MPVILHYAPRVELHVEFDGDMRLDDYIRFIKACDEILEDMKKALVQRIGDLNNDVTVRVACADCA